MPSLRRHTSLRRFAALAALALALHAAFLWPLPERLASAIPYTTHAGAAPARPLVQGDHLQLLYHFDLFDAYLHGDLPWFRNLWEFNTSDAARPRRPDLCYAPFALPYSLARRAGATDAFAWNAAQWLSILLGLAFVYALARRFGAGPAAAFGIAATVHCLPYRGAVLAGGSPTGFGMGLVPGVALGVDLAVRDRRLRGGALAGALLPACYAADLHCFLFAALSVPFWGLVALLRAPENPFATRRRVRALVAACAPVALGGALCGALGWAAKRAYAATDAAGGRSLADLRRHSPDWHAFFDPTFFSHFPDQFHHGAVFAALLALAGLALLAAFGVALARLLRPRRAAPFRSPSIVFHPSFSSHPAAAPRPGTAALRAALAGLALAAAILFALGLALGTAGPADALPLRLVRKLVPPFRMVRQPLKALCLLPTLSAAFFALAWGAALAPAAAALRRRLATAPGPLSRLAAAQRDRAPAAQGAGRGSRVAGRTMWMLAALPAIAMFAEVHRGMRAGLCLLPGPDEAYAAVVADAAARGETARALVLPIWPGDSSWSSIYQYRAMRAGLRMLNGYAAVTEPDYVQNVFRRFESLTEGDVSDAQLDALRALGVTAVILHEDAFPEKVSPFPFGRTLRRLLERPGLSLLAKDGAPWAFRVESRESQAAGRKPQAASRNPAEEGYGATARHWKLKDPAANAGTWVYVSPENAKDARWIVRAEAEKPVVLVASAKEADGAVRASTNAAPALAAPAGAWRCADVAAAPPGAGRRTRLATPGEARISDVAFAPVGGPEAIAPPDAEGLVRIPLWTLQHDFGETLLDPATGRPHALRFTPERDPPCVAVRGPCVPCLPAGRYRVEALDVSYFDAAGAPQPRGWIPPVRLLGADGLVRALSPASRDAVFETDGSFPLAFEIHYDRRGGLTWELGDLLLRRLPD